jgi:Bacterial SH3 domain
MSKIVIVTAVLVLIAVPLAMGRAQAPPPAHFVPPPGVAPPWANATTTNETTTTTETPPPAAPSAAPAAVAVAQPAETAKPGTTTAAPVTETLMQGTTTPIHVVSLRAGPNGTAPIIGTLHPGDQLEILATANYGWTEVRSPAGTGWAYGSYLASGGAAAAQPPAPIMRP